MEIDLNKIPKSEDLERNDFLLFSETQSRFIVTIDPKRKEEFEEHFKDFKIAEIGKITEEQNLIINGLDGTEVINTNLETLNENYRKLFKNY